MLRELHISNLAVIADARIELTGGLNCFTGATGAGKSLVIGAVEVLLGLRSPSEMLRAGAGGGRVRGGFGPGGRAPPGSLQRPAGRPGGAGRGEPPRTPRLFASGRSQLRLNRHPITLGMLKQVAELLVDVHGQHDHHYLLKPSNQIDVVDQFGELSDLRRRYHEVFAELAEAKQRQIGRASCRERELIEVV